MADRRAQTMQLSGNEYAKVAERLKLFRTDFAKSKTETAYEYDVDQTVVFTVWLWKDKADLIELMKSGITDKGTLRASADANGTAKGEPVAKKDFEKLETIALGRALGMMGYLASGEIASFEEQEEFERFREEQQEQLAKEAVEKLEASKTMDELKKAFVATGLMQHPDVVAAKDRRKSQLSETQPAAPPKPTTIAKTPPQKPATPLDTPTALPLDEESVREDN